MKHIKIASRASKLALVQSNYIRDLLLNLSDDLEVSIVEISTKGDRDKSDFLYKTDSMGFFTSEVEKALLDRRADIAVHSLKDLPTSPAEGLIVAAMPKRESPADALIAQQGITSIDDLPPGSTIGTSSLRRIAQIKHHRKDLNCVPLRGNVETRVNKVKTGQVDAAILACAGLNRLSLSDNISATLPLKDFIPAPAQGALAVECRANDSEVIDLLTQLDDKPTRIAAQAERAILAEMHGGCSIPLGVHAQIKDDKITINAMISDTEAENYIKRTKTDTIDNIKTLTKTLAHELLEAGGQNILDQIRNERDNQGE
jgi:hydroxymethylbilane synthase